MKVKGLALLTVMTVAMSTVLVSCGQQKEKNNSTSLVQEEQNVAAKAETTTTQETTTQATDETTKSENPTLSYSQIQSLPTQVYPWGCGYAGADHNIPDGCINYQKKFGKYDADFVRTDKQYSKKIYLTSDEGYENGYTSKLLDALKEKDVKIVFFVTLPYAKSEPKLVQRMIDEGHIVGAHSCTHPSGGLPTLSLEKQKEEFTKLDEYMVKHFNYKMHVFRFPEGVFTEQSLALAQSLGYTSVFWSFAYADWDVNNQMDHKTALKKVVNGLHPGAIYLLHAVSSTNAAIMGDFIDQARAKGYTFERYY